MVLIAEVGGREQAGLTTGVGVAFLLAGILLGGPLFGVVLERTDSYAIAWGGFSMLAGVIGVAVVITGRLIAGRRSSATQERASASRPHDGSTRSVAASDRRE